MPQLPKTFQLPDFGGTVAGQPESCKPSKLIDRYFNHPAPFNA